MREIVRARNKARQPTTLVRHRSPNRKASRMAAVPCPSTSHERIVHDLAEAEKRCNLR
jgi:hypothetical protein